MNPLTDLLQARLAQGPVPAAEVMALGLYHPEHGYYRRQTGPWGFEGKDYYTALDLGPLLGQTLALRLEAAWERLGRPATFTALEPGAGRGWLGRDLLTAASGPFARALVYLHRDDNPAARAAAPWRWNSAISAPQCCADSPSAPTINLYLHHPIIFHCRVGGPRFATRLALSRRILTT